MILSPDQKDTIIGGIPHLLDGFEGDLTRIWAGQTVNQFNEYPPQAGYDSDIYPVIVLSILSEGQSRQFNGDILQTYYDPVHKIHYEKKGSFHQATITARIHDTDHERIRKLAYDFVKQLWRSRGFWRMDKDNLIFLYCQRPTETPSYHSEKVGKKIYVIAIDIQIQYEFSWIEEFAPILRFDNTFENLPSLSSIHFLGSAPGYVFLDAGLSGGYWRFSLGARLSR